MPQYRALISTFKSTEPARDYITNTVYFDDHGATTDAQNLANDLAGGWVSQRPYPAGFDRVNVRFYDMNEPTPREIQGETTAVITPSGTQACPREVALCLSFFSERNLPRQRGRIYLGPWAAPCVERPTQAMIDAAISYAALFRNLGGQDVDWCVYSRTSPPGNSRFKPVTNIWCDNEWDTIRSRGMIATTRNAVDTADE